MRDILNVARRVWPIRLGHDIMMDVDFFTFHGVLQLVRGMINMFLDKKVSYAGYGAAIVRLKIWT